MTSCFCFCCVTINNKLNENREDCIKYTILDSIKIMETYPDEYYNIHIDSISKKYFHLMMPFCHVSLKK